MYKYESKLQELGMTEDQLSNPTKKIIKELKDFEPVKGELANQIKSGKLSQQDKEEAERELSDIQADIEHYDNDLVAKIVRYHAQKDRIDAFAQQARDRAKNKKKPATVAEAGAVVAPEATPPVETPAEPDGKKGNSVAAFLGVLGVIGLAAIGIRWYQKNN
jgi:chromosome segregation ATPase